MKPRLGRPKLKAKERKEIFPLRLSALELQAIKDTAGNEPLAKWMRRTLLAATGIVSEVDIPGALANADTLIEDDTTGALVRVPLLAGLKSGVLKQSGKPNLKRFGKTQKIHR